MIGALLLAASVGSWQQLPTYRPQQHVTGTIRNHGFALGGLLQKWERAFERFQPDVRFADTLPTSDSAMPALITGVSDLGPDGGEASLTENLAFYETYGYNVSSVTVASGAYDVEGRSNGIIVYVNSANPIAQLTLRQLDAIFGAPRTGALDGFKWMISDALSARSEIRTWGQLGLHGSWAARPIQTYGHAPSGTTRFFQSRVMHGADKWNPNYREYVETGSKMIGSDDPHQLGGLKHMLADELAHDKYGIAWTVEPQARGIAGIKAIALSQGPGGAYVLPSRASFENRTYPLVRNIYIFFKRAPHTQLDPKLREFLRFILSRDGQAIVARDGNYLPLPSDFARKQLAQLE